MKKERTVKLLPDATCKLLAYEICNLLRAHEMWVDTKIYFNGKALSTDNGNENEEETEYRYNGEPFLLEDQDPYEWEPFVTEKYGSDLDGFNCNTLFISMGSPLYDVYNYSDVPDSRLFLENFQELLYQYGLEDVLVTYELLSVEPLKESDITPPTIAKTKKKYDFEFDEDEEELEFDAYEEEYDSSFAGMIFPTAKVTQFLKEADFEVFVNECVQRYTHKDWGDSPEVACKSNGIAAESEEGSILASYPFPEGKCCEWNISDDRGGLENKLWIKTEWDHRVTTILFPSEY